MRWRLALFPLLTGCAASLSGSRQTTIDPAVLVGSHIEVIRGSENGLELLQRSNPLYLNARVVRPSVFGTGFSDPIAVYVNGAYSGDLDALRMLPAREIVSIRRVSASEGASIFGRTHTNGALLVKLRR